jgi:hypothetical protein
MGILSAPTIPYRHRSTIMKRLPVLAICLTLLWPAALTAQIIDDTPPDTARGQPADSTMIRLNPNDPTFDLWKLLRDRSNDPAREPGPIHVQRYAGEMGWSGIPTFFRLPVALNPEDLRAGNVDVAILGAGLDMSGGMRGAAYGPRKLRANNEYVASSGFSMPHMHTMVNPFQVLSIVDYGDAHVDPFSTERSVHHIRDIVREIAETGTMPVVVGGDHSLEYPNVAAVTDVHGKGNVAVIHFDAHYDGSNGGVGSPGDSRFAGLSTHQRGTREGQPLHPGGPAWLLPGLSVVRVDARAGLPLSHHGGDRARRVPGRDGPCASRGSGRSGAFVHLG